MTYLLFGGTNSLCVLHPLYLFRLIYRHFTHTLLNLHSSTYLSPIHPTWQHTKYSAAAFTVSLPLGVIYNYTFANLCAFRYSPFSFPLFSLFPFLLFTWYIIIRLSFCSFLFYSPFILLTWYIIISLQTYTLTVIYIIRLQTYTFDVLYIIRCGLYVCRSI